MKALFIGLGSIGQRHLRNVRRVLGDECELIAYRATDGRFVYNDAMEVDTTRKIEDVHPITVFASLEEALAQSPDIAFISNPTNLHVSTAIEVVKAGCHALIEKPLSDTMDGVSKLTRLASESDVVVQVGFQMRFHPALRMAHESLHAGEIGHPITARLEIGEYLPNWHPWEDYRIGYAARSDLGGGALATQSHEFDYASWLFGAPLRIAAFGGHLSSLEVDVEDAVSILMECRVDGRLVPVTLDLDYVQRKGVRRCTVVGDSGRLIVDLLSNSIEITGADGGVVESRAWPDFERNQLFIDELETFLGAVRGVNDPLPTLEEGIVSLRAIDAARRAMRSKQMVEL